MPTFIAAAVVATAAADDDNDDDDNDRSQGLGFRLCKCFHKASANSRLRGSAQLLPMLWVRVAFREASHTTHSLYHPHREQATAGRHLQLLHVATAAAGSDVITLKNCNNGR